MLARVMMTGAVLSVSALDFFDGSVTIEPMNPLGILFLALSGVIWFSWEMFRDAYAYREEICPNQGHAFLQAERLGPAQVHGLVRREND